MGGRHCKVHIWASSIGPSRHALLAGGLLGHGTSGEIVAASSRLGPIELELFGGGIRPAWVQRGVPGESPAAETQCRSRGAILRGSVRCLYGLPVRTFKTCAFGRWPKERKKENRHPKGGMGGRPVASSDRHAGHLEHLECSH